MNKNNDKKLYSLWIQVNKVIKNFDITDFKKSYSEEIYHTTIIRNYLFELMHTHKSEHTNIDNNIIEEASEALSIFNVLFLSILTIMFIYEGIVYGIDGNITLLATLVSISVAIFLLVILLMKNRVEEYFIYTILMIIIVPITAKLLSNFKIIFTTKEPLTITLETFSYLIILFLIPSMYHKITNSRFLKIKIKRLSGLYKKYESRLLELSHENLNINI